MRSGLPAGRLPRARRAREAQVRDREAGQPGLRLARRGRSRPRRGSRRPSRSPRPGTARSPSGGCGSRPSSGCAPARRARGRRRSPDRGRTAPPRCPRSPRRCPGTPTARRRAAPRCVRRIIWNSDCGLRARRRRTKSALKILCRQCSLFACANIISSTSVGSRPSVAVARRRGSRSRRARARARARRSRARARARPSPPSATRPSGRGAGRANSRAASLGRSSTDSVMRSASARAKPASSTISPDDDVADAALDAPHRREAADVRDVGRLRRPRRDRAEARHDHSRRPEATVARPALSSAGRGP